jgi:hypothetical protein
MCHLDGAILGTQVGCLGGSWWYGIMRMRDAAVCYRLIQIGNSFSLGSVLNNVMMLKELNAVI